MQSFNSVLTSHNNLKTTINNLDFNEDIIFNPKHVDLDSVLAKSFVFN